MKDRIGEIAGRIWTILGEKQDVDILKLPKILKEKGEIVYQALGWLAREDKINYHTKERKTFVSLIHGGEMIVRKAGRDEFLTQGEGLVEVTGKWGLRSYGYGCRHPFWKRSLTLTLTLTLNTFLFKEVLYGGNGCN